MPSSHLFWPSHRKLFRRRSHVWAVVPIFAVVATALLVVAFGHIDWS